MMERSKQCLKILKIITMLITLFIFLFYSGFNVYALNENYVIDEYHNWLDVDNRYDYQRNSDGFDGFIKNVSDESDGSFYIFFKFFDSRIANGNDENVVLTFTVENSKNRYQFSVNKDGFINTGQNDMNAVRLVSNFDNFSCSSMGGEIFVGFELKNKTDRVLTNYISCAYAAGVDTTTVLFEDEVLDLFAESAENATTKKSAKSTAARDKTSQKKNSASAKNTTAKSVKSKNSDTTKFKGSGKYIVDHNDNYDHAETITDDEISEIYSQNSDVKMSATAITVLIISIIAVVAGIIILTVAFVSKTQTYENEKNNEDKESSL